LERVNFRLSRNTYLDKVWGCFLGKNAGGSLGTPYERIWGQEGMLKVQLNLEEIKSLPNDDLEIQVIWLNALEERGLGLTSRDLADYWIDWVGYNFDEYGLSKRNLRLGLSPPLSGWYNNWFKDCMGSPIRSEIWACIAPGLPNVAASYAFKDAIVDHAGGESVYGEVFNAALQAAAFVKGSVEELIQFGLTFIPEWSLTHRAVKEAVKAHREGLTLEEARERVRRIAPSPVAQYSPVNLGFQALGLLYGQGFWDSLVKTVSLGYDTDSTAGTVGAILGIMAGRSGLPAEVQDLFERIDTNESWGGVRLWGRGVRGVREMAERVVRVGRTLLSLSVPLDREDFVIPDPLSCPRDGEWWSYEPKSEHFSFPGLKVDLVYPEGPVVTPTGDLPLRLILRNTRASQVDLRYRVDLQGALTLSPGREGRISVEGNSSREVQLWVGIRDLDSLAPVEHGSLSLRAEGYPDLGGVPLVLLAPRLWFYSKVRGGEGGVERWVSDSAEGKWPALFLRDNDLGVERLFGERDPRTGKGIEEGEVALVHFLFNPRETRDVNIGFPTNSSVKAWFNGEMAVQAEGDFNLRPNYGGDGRNYAGVTLRHGWNWVVVKLSRRGKPVEAHFVISESRAKLFSAITDLVEHRVPPKDALGL